MKWAIAENMVTITCTAALILGLYAMGAGGWSFLGLLLMSNLNTAYQVKQAASSQRPSDQRGAG